MKTQKEFFHEFLEHKYQTLWTLQWEIESMENQFKDLLREGAILAARTALAKARENNASEEAIVQLENDVTQAKDAQKTLASFKQTREDLLKQIAYFENKPIDTLEKQAIGK